MPPCLFGNRFYGHRTPAFHQLGLVTEKDMTGNEALTAIGGGFWFEQRPASVVLNGILTETEDLAIVRSATIDDPTERIFGYTTSRYNLFQPIEAIDLFDLHVSEPIETIGFLGKGEKMFLTWKLDNFEVVKDDELINYGFLALGFDAIFGCSLNVVNTRVVCQNTMNFALKEAETATRNGDKNKGIIFSGKHTSKNLKRDLGIWMGYVQGRANYQNQLVKDFFGNLVKHPLSEEKEVYRLLFEAYPDPQPISVNYPDALKAEKQLKIDAQAEKAEGIRNGIYELFSGKGTGITGSDYYNLFNCSTEYLNWGQPTKKDPSVSIMIGQRSKDMNSMANVLQKEMNNKK
jgi:hypothetical protein